jgi:hypothetical protein
MNKLEYTTWNNWTKIQKEKAMDEKGFIRCETCNDLVFYEEIKLGVYYKAKFPLWFNSENNYFCCNHCRPNTDVKQYAIKRMQSVPEIIYSTDDLNQFNKKLETILKNTTWQKIRELD